MTDPAPDPAARPLASKIIHLAADLADLVSEDPPLPDHSGIIVMAGCVMDDGRLDGEASATGADREIVAALAGGLAAIAGVRDMAPRFAEALAAAANLLLASLGITPPANLPPRGDAAGEQDQEQGQ